MYIPLPAIDSDRALRSLFAGQVSAKKIAVTGSNIQVPATVRAMVRGGGPADKARNDRRFGKVYSVIYFPR